MIEFRDKPGTTKPKAEKPAKPDMAKRKPAVDRRVTKPSKGAVQK